MSARLSRLYRRFEALFIKCWWVMLFVMGCYFFYEQGLLKRDQDFSKLHRQYTKLLKEKKTSQALQEDLTLQINSQSDPAYIELTLMKGLGLTPEGSTKVLFNSDTAAQRANLL